MLDVANRMLDVSWATGRHRIEQSVTFCRSRTAGFGPQFIGKAADVENKRLDWKSQIRCWMLVGWSGHTTGEMRRGCRDGVMISSSFVGWERRIDGRWSAKGRMLDVGCWMLVGCG